MEEQPGAWDTGLAEVEENGHMSHGNEAPQVSVHRPQQEQSSPLLQSSG